MTTIKILNFTGALYECEYCGYHNAESTTVFVDGEEVWQQYSDGHMSGSETERPVVDCILEAWHNNGTALIEQEYTEEARVEWNDAHPGNWVAATPENWLTTKNEVLVGHADNLAYVKADCEKLPGELHLRIRMIALWMEAHTGEPITVEIENEIEAAEDNEY